MELPEAKAQPDERNMLKKLAKKNRPVPPSDRLPPHVIGLRSGDNNHCPTVPSMASPISAPTFNPQSRSPILIGTEYIPIENANRVRRLAELLAPLGLEMAKPLPETIAWGNMQTSPDAPIAGVHASL